jgi:hypothetical protein
VLEQSSRQKPDLLGGLCGPLRNCAREMCPPPPAPVGLPFAPLRTLTSASLPRETGIIPITRQMGTDNRHPARPIHRIGKSHHRAIVRQRDLLLIQRVNRSA